MISIYLYSLISSFYLNCAGNILLSKDSDKNIYSFAIFGSIFLSFLALFANFFIPLSLSFNSIILILILIFGLLVICKNKRFLSTLRSCIFISVISTIILTLDTINRPDASLYHLPYTKILNDDKIIFGIANIHIRFGHTSILQYINALFNNFLFKENGILLPASIIFSSIVLFIFKEIRKNFFKYKPYVIYLFFIFAYILYKYNRYSEFGNDVIAHLILIITSIYFLKINFENVLIKNFFYKILLLSFFCFMLKPTLILGLILPIFCFYKYLNFNFKQLLNLNIFFVFVFISSWIIKNLIVSGCLIYPIQFTCFESLQWFSNDLRFDISPNLQSLDNEAWTKGWPDYKGDKISQELYVKNFFWFKTWFMGHGLEILQKLSFFIFFIFIYLFSINKIAINSKKENFKDIIDLKKKIWFLFFLSLIGIFLWFVRFPVFRYGSSYLVIFICISATLISIKYNIEIKNSVLFKKYTNIFLLTILVLFTAKHSLRVFKNKDLNYLNYPWPQFISERQNDNNFKSDPILIDDEIMYYLVKSDDGCGYSLSPCTPYPVKNVKMSLRNTYKFFTLNK